MSKDKSIKRAQDVAKALAEAKTDRKQASKKASKETAKKSPQEYERGEQFQEGQFGGSGAVTRARQRHFASSGNRVVRHPGVSDFASMPMLDVKDDDGAVS